MTETQQAIHHTRQVWYHEWATVSDRIAELKEQGESLVEELGRAPLPTKYGDWTFIEYGDKTTGYHHHVLVFGNLKEGSLGNGEDVLTRMHSACWTNHVARAINCECDKEWEKAMVDIQHEGKGIMIYLEQEGRGTGIGKMYQLNEMFEWKNGRIIQRRDENGERIDTDRAYREAGFPSECRDFSVAGDILDSLGVKSVRLVTNNPQKIVGIEQAGIEVKPVEIHIPPENGIIASDLKSKAENLGHNIRKEDWQL